MNITRKITIIRRISLLAVCFFMVFILCGCQGAGGAAEPKSEAEIREMIDTSEILDGRHRRDENYSVDFSTRYISVGEKTDQIKFALHMADKSYDEAKLKECAFALWEDLSKLTAFTEIAPCEVTVYLMREGTCEAPVSAGAEIFCTLEDFESGAYRDALCEGAYGLSSAWQACGLAGCAFLEADDVDLKAYYEDESHALTATCSALHLSPLISDEETVYAARETARSLAAYVIEKDGFGAFVEVADPMAKLPGWLESAGISVKLPEVREEMTVLRVYSNPSHLAEIKVNNLRVFVNEDSYLRDADEIYLWMQDYYAGMDLVIEQILEEVPSVAETLEKRLNEAFEIDLVSQMNMTVAEPLTNKVVLSNSGNIWHEMVHILLEEYVPNEDLWWECEAIAEHFSHRAQTTYAPTTYICNGLDEYVEFFAEESGKEANDDDMVYHKKVCELYEKFADPAWSDRDDLAAFCHAYGISSIILDGKIERTQVRRKYDTPLAEKRGYGAGRKAVEGNGLTYPEAEVVFEYLAGCFGDGSSGAADAADDADVASGSGATAGDGGGAGAGIPGRMDTMVDAYMNGLSLEKAIGISYADAYKEAKEYFSEKYGG